MSVQRIAARYAKSLIDLAKEQDKLETIKDDMLSFLEVVKNRDFYLMLKSPIVHASSKAKIFRSLFGEKYNKMTLSFFDIILNKNRESYLADIASEFMEQYKELKQISSITLITASQVDSSFIESVRKKFEGSSFTRKHVEIVHNIDPSIIGGFKVEFEDKLYDSSIKRQLEQVKKQFSANYQL